MIRYLLSLTSIVLGTFLIVSALYIKFQFEMPWGSEKGSHIKAFPGEWVLIGVSMALWGVVERVLHGWFPRRNTEIHDQVPQSEENK